MTLVARKALARLPATHISPLRKLEDSLVDRKRRFEVAKRSETFRIIPTVSLAPNYAKLPSKPK